MVWGHESIGHRIRHLRNEFDWTQEELGKRIDLSVATIKRIENDRIDIAIYREYLERIATAFGMKPEDLVLNNAKLRTRELLDEMYTNGDLTKEEAEEIFQMAQPKMRSNASEPLGRDEILMLRDIFRGH